MLRIGIRVLGLRVATWLSGGCGFRHIWISGQVNLCMVMPSLESRTAGHIALTFLIHRVAISSLHFHQGAADATPTGLELDEERTCRPQKQIHCESHLGHHLWHIERDSRRLINCLPTD